jgi:hypothetical protein
MSAGDLLSLFGGASGGTALVFCALFITGLIFPKGSIEDRDKTIAEKNEEIKELKHALDLERQRSDIMVQVGHVVRDVMTNIPPRELNLCGGLGRRQGPWREQECSQRELSANCPSNDWKRSSRSRGRSSR